jgi:hypothetical protein
VPEDLLAVRRAGVEVTHGGEWVPPVHPVERPQIPRRRVIGPRRRTPTAERRDVGVLVPGRRPRRLSASRSPMA